MIIEENGQIRKISKDTKILPGLQVLHTPVHTEGGLTILIDTSAGRAAITGFYVHRYDSLGIADHQKIVCKWIDEQPKSKSRHFLTGFVLKVFNIRDCAIIGVYCLLKFYVPTIFIFRMFLVFVFDLNHFVFLCQISVRVCEKYN